MKSHDFVSAASSYVFSFSVSFASLYATSFAPETRANLSSEEAVTVSFLPLASVPVAEILPIAFQPLSVTESVAGIVIT